MLYFLVPFLKSQHICQWLAHWGPSWAICFFNWNFDDSNRIFLIFWVILPDQVFSIYHSWFLHDWSSCDSRSARFVQCFLCLWERMHKVRSNLAELDLPDYWPEVVLCREEGCYSDLPTHWLVMLVSLKWNVLLSLMWLFYSSYKQQFEWKAALSFFIEVCLLALVLFSATAWTTTSLFTFFLG